MESERPFTKEKLVIGILLSKIRFKKALCQRLTDHFGQIDYQSQLLDFNFTNYYDKEIGTPIKRFFVAFKNLIYPQQLSNIKRITNGIEDQFRENGKRKINLDPGLLCLSRFILASTKDSSHRIPLHQGIYAEITLMYEKGAYRPLEWTYPDYRSKPYQEILKKIRNIFFKQRKAPAQ